MSEKLQRDFKGIWIPKDIWLSKGLTLQEKLFLAEIDSLDNDEGCFAGNSHFSEFFGLSKNRCSEIIKSLEKKGYVSIYYKKNKENNSIDKRIIKVLDKPKGYSESRLTPSENRLTCSESRLTPSEKCEGSNTTNNTINNTTITTTTKEKESSCSSPETLENKLEIDENFKTIVQAYQQEGFGAITTISAQLIDELLEEYSTEWILEAMKVAVESNKRTLKYVRGVLRNWKADGGMKTGGENSGKSSNNTKGTGSGERTSKESDEFYRKAKEKGWLDIDPDELDVDF